MNKLCIIALLVFCSVIISSAESQSIVSVDNLVMTEDSIAIAHIKIETNGESGLGATTLGLSFDPNIVQILDVSNSDFDSLTYNIDNEVGLVNIVTYQTGSTGVSPGIVNYADVELKAIGTEGSDSTLSLDVVTLKNNDGIAISHTINSGQVSINRDYSGDDGGSNLGEGLQAKAGAEVAGTPDPAVNQASENGTTEVDKLIDVVGDSAETNVMDETSFKTEEPDGVKSTPAFSFLLSILSILLLTIVLKQKNQGEL